ncbi:MAG: hypothetical protein AABX03_04250 [Nanoarchaeota archaeon]
MHIKRQAVSKLWPVPRKGTKYLVVPSHSKNNGIPLLIAMRDDLKLVSRRKELEKILHEKKIMVNGKVVKEDNLALLLFDKIEIKTINKSYNVNFSKTGKLVLEELNNKDSESKIAKIINKKIMKGNKVQINLSDGRNILSNDKVKTGDSIKFNLKSKKIDSILPVKEKAKVIVLKGRHLGNYGTIKEINGKKIIVNSHLGDFETKNEDLMVVE